MTLASTWSARGAVSTTARRRVPTSPSFLDGIGRGLDAMGLGVGSIPQFAGSFRAEGEGFEPSRQATPCVDKFDRVLPKASQLRGFCVHRPVKSTQRPTKANRQNWTRIGRGVDAGVQAVVA